MTEKEKMLAGQIYDPSDEELLKLRQNAHILSKKYNDCFETDAQRTDLLHELIPHMGENVYLQGPVQFDYGCFTEIGKNTYANFNFTCLDCAPVKIGNDVFIGPNVSLLTPVHPFRFQDRNMYRRADGVYTDREYAKPITIGDNCRKCNSVRRCHDWQWYGYRCGKCGHTRYSGRCPCGRRSVPGYPGDYGGRCVVMPPGIIWIIAT